MIHSESSIKCLNKGDDSQPVVRQDQAQPVVISLSHQQLSFPFTCGAPYQGLMALFHCTVRFGTARYGTVRLSSGRFAFPLQFSTALEWAGLFTCHYSCAASTAVTSS